MNTKDTRHEGMDLISAIDDWFKRHCDNTWEHHNGITIESTDNPGWLLTVPACLDRKKVDQFQNILNDLKTEIAIEGEEVRIWSSTLQNCLQTFVLLL